MPRDKKTAPIETPNLPNIAVKQERFVLNLAEGMDQPAAYLKAGYAGKPGSATTQVNSCKLANSAPIQEWIFLHELGG